VSKSNCVYFVSDGGAVKIGFTADLEGRIAALQTGCKSRLELLAVIRGGTRSTEKLLHEFFAPYRLHGEWFARKKHLHAFIAFVHGGAQPKTLADIMLLVPTPLGGKLALLRTKGQNQEPKQPWSRRLAARPRIVVPLSLAGTPMETKLLELDSVAHDHRRGQKEIGAAMAAIRRIVKITGLDLTGGK
jgi:hypothetical protein